MSQRYRYDRQTQESWGDVVKRLQGEARPSFRYMWRLACDQRDQKGAGKGRYDPSADEDFSERCIRDFRHYDLDMNNLAWHRGLRIDRAQLRADEEQAAQRLEGRNAQRGKGKGQQTRDKDRGKRPRDQDWAGAGSAPQRYRTGI